MDGIVAHKKCVKCHRILHVDKLVENKNGIGMVCLDSEACNKVLNKIKEKQ